MGKCLPASHTLGLHPGMMHAEISEETAVRRGSKSLGGKDRQHQEPALCWLGGLGQVNICGPQFPLLQSKNSNLKIQLIQLSCCCSVTTPYPTLGDPTDCSMPGFPVLRYFPKCAQIHVHWVSDAISPSHPLSPPSLFAFNLSQHQGLFQWVGSLHQVAKVLWGGSSEIILDWTKNSFGFVIRYRKTQKNFLPTHINFSKCPGTFNTR